MGTFLVADQIQLCHSTELYYCVFCSAPGSWPRRRGVGLSVLLLPSGKIEQEEKDEKKTKTAQVLTLHRSMTGRSRILRLPSRRFPG